MAFTYGGPDQFENPQKSPIKFVPKPLAFSCSRPHNKGIRRYSIVAARNGTQGMNWIKREKRLALYLRDGLACVYCGDGVEDGATLTLDHLTPNVKGGTNDASNLVTACHRCNTARGTRSVAAFCRAVAEYLDHGVQAKDIEAHVRKVTRRQYSTAQARALLESRGSWAAALKS